ncbi:MAG: hypothetical protein F6J86_35755 [Symploca sp. SIO1B1]|nr:hypothetical protein [Symploca sp. SIO1B1]
MNWNNSFIFKQKRLYYNRIPFNNCSERSVEIPIAFDFLANLRKKDKILEVGNVLGYYENLLSEYLGIMNRRIVDKFEETPGVDNIDLMDIPTEDKYDAIVSVSTVEHVKQGIEPSGAYGEQIEVRDLEGPLKAIAKIYELLLPGGTGLITVPIGKLLDLEWLIHFNSEYLNLLVSKYEIPQDAICINFLKRLTLYPPINNPLQLWAEVGESQVSNVNYNWPWPCANAIAVVELNKLTENFTLKLDLSPTPLQYKKTIYKKPVIYHDLIKDDFLNWMSSLREINLIFCPDWNQTEELIYSDFEKIVSSILKHPDRSYICLLIEASNIPYEEANLFLASVTMNLLMQEDFAIDDEPEFLLLDQMSNVQWSALTTNINAQIILDNQNNNKLTEVVKQNISYCPIECFKSKRAVKLETGLWEFS